MDSELKTEIASKLEGDARTFLLAFLQVGTSEPAEFLETGLSIFRNFKKPRTTSWTTT